MILSIVSRQANSLVMAKSSVKRGDKQEGKKPGGHSMNPDRNIAGLKGVAKPRTAGTIKRLAMYKNFKAKRDKKGKILKAAPYQVFRKSRFPVLLLC